MEVTMDMISKLNIPSEQLKSELIQVVIQKAQKNLMNDKIKGSVDRNKIKWVEVVDILWLHLQSGLSKYDDQLLCGTCFYTVLSLTDKQEHYLNEVLNIVNFLNKEFDHDTNSLKIGQVVSLMYGIFQSSFLKEVKPNLHLIEVLLSLYKLLLKLAYEYSKYTFITFKTISLFKKVCGTELQATIFSKDNQMRLLDLTIHNWENPITGIRDLNKDIFKMVIPTLNDDLYESLLNEIDGLYWNKAKYLMLSEIISHNNNITFLLQKYDWIDGLINSLHKSGLVSAGADMYYALLTKLFSEDKWCDIFLVDIIEILNGSSEKAIDNFSNYWCLTTFKKFPAIANILISELENLIHSEQKLYSSLCILKHANKFGLVDKNWSTINKDLYVQNIILAGLEHCNPRIRMLAFELVCVSSCKSIPINVEYDIVLNFIFNNINSDCTILRLSLMTHFKSFLSRVHLSDTRKVSSNEINNLKHFCEKFQAQIIGSLDLNGNYQRKVASLKVLHIYLQSRKEMPNRRQIYVSESNKTLMDMLKEIHRPLFDEKFTMKLVKILSDPAEDVRENVIELLLCHYSKELRQTNFINYLTDCALLNRKSKYFYEISCGQSMFKLLCNSLIKERHLEARFTCVEDIFFYAYNELITEYELQRSVIETIHDGKQLHSFLSILHVVLDTCKKKGCIINIPKDTILQLLTTLDGISKQFTSEENSSTSADFSKMSDMVEGMIEASGFSTDNENEYSKISGMHQMILNSLWLNVKATCDLCSLLIQYQKEDCDTCVCEKSLKIITHVLETCRHKGAIEAAGTALGEGIRYLTTMPRSSNIYELPHSLLQRKLSDLISETNKMASVTRRGAGLSIMVHRIVSNDVRKNKPLFHYFMKTILEVCSSTTNIPTELNTDSHNNENDLPKAIYIHFLTKIVIDSSLASDVMYYSVKLAEIAFDNLINPQWQIRNAALQLYGALISKLIGQKKASGVGEEITATVAYDELRTHSPKLFNNIQLLLLRNCNSKDIQHHSNLVPVLNMLANIARRYNFQDDLLKQRDTDNIIFKSLTSLLKSPIYTVRRLTATCIYNIFPFMDIYNFLMKYTGSSENLLHGCLMLMSKCYKQYYCNMYKNQFQALKGRYGDILNTGNHSYLCKAIFEEMYCNILNLNHLKESLAVLESKNHEPGVFLWINMLVKRFIIKTSWSMIPQILEIILAIKDVEYYCEMLIIRIEESDIPDDVLLKIASMLLSYRNNYNSSVIWKALYKISIKTELRNIEIGVFNNYLLEKDRLYKWRYMIPFIVRISTNNGNPGCLKMLAKLIYSLTDCETNDVDMRYIAAISNSELGFLFPKLSNRTKVIAIQSAVILLQDEDEDVRNKAVYFYKNLTSNEEMFHPYICLNKILEHKFLVTIMSETDIDALYQELNDVLLKKNNCNNIDAYNPFANDSKNIYLEVEVLKQILENLKKQ